MLNIENNARLMMVDDLRRQGYTEQQIRFMISHIPELLADGDEKRHARRDGAGPATGYPWPGPVGNSTHDTVRQSPAGNGPANRRLSGQEGSTRPLSSGRGSPTWPRFYPDKPRGSGVDAWFRGLRNSVG